MSDLPPDHHFEAQCELSSNFHAISYQLIDRRALFHLLQFQDNFMPVKSLIKGSFDCAITPCVRNWLVKLEICFLALALRLISEKKFHLKKICCDDFQLTTVRGSGIKKLKGDGEYWSEHERRKKTTSKRIRMSLKVIAKQRPTAKRKKSTEGEKKMAKIRFTNTHFFLARGAVELLYCCIGNGWCCCSNSEPFGCWWLLLMAFEAAVETLVIVFCLNCTSWAYRVGKKPTFVVPRIYPSRSPQSVDPTTSITSPGWIARCPLTFDSYFSMHTTVVLGCPIEQVADSELVPTPDESLIISLVSPRLLSGVHSRQWNIKNRLISWHTNKREN